MIVAHDKKNLMPLKLLTIYIFTEKRALAAPKICDIGYVRLGHNPSNV